MQFSLRQLLTVATCVTLASWYVVTFHPEETVWGWWITCSAPLLAAALAVALAFQGFDRLWSAFYFGQLAGTTAAVFMLDRGFSRTPWRLDVVLSLAFAVHVATFCGGVQLLFSGSRSTGIALLGIVMLSGAAIAVSW